MEIILSNQNLIAWVLIPILIFTARVVDVTIGTVKIILISRGYKLISASLAFVEVLIWLVAMSQIMQNLTNFWYYIAFATGFATGTFVGMYIEEKIAIGVVLIQIITKNDATELIGFLREKGYGVTIVNAKGNSGPVDIIYTIIKRRNFKNAINAINNFNPQAFYSIEDIRSVKEGVFPPKTPFYKINYSNFLGAITKRK